MQTIASRINGLFSAHKKFSNRCNKSNQTDKIDNNKKEWYMNKKNSKLKYHKSLTNEEKERKIKENFCLH